jgi:hypothetical protein
MSCSDIRACSVCRCVKAYQHAVSCVGLTGFVSGFVCMWVQHFLCARVTAGFHPAVEVFVRHSLY